MFTFANRVSDRLGIGRLLDLFTLFAPRTGRQDLLDFAGFVDAIGVGRELDLFENSLDILLVLDRAGFVAFFHFLLERDNECKIDGFKGALRDDPGIMVVNTLEGLLDGSCRLQTVTGDVAANLVFQGFQFFIADKQLLPPESDTEKLETIVDMCDLAPFVQTKLQFIPEKRGDFPQSLFSIFLCLR